MNYETVIGLEIHAQLLTVSKMFCGCSTKFGNPPNSNICPVCTGQPGVLPVMNRKTLNFALKTALALNCKIAGASIFARKNYFYPDLPKNYQISQYELPIAEHGYLEIEVNGKIKKIGIKRVHLEEDAGKLVHKGSDRIAGADYSLVDLNRTGIPLMEIVSDPDIKSPQEARIFMTELRSILRYLEVCDGNLEEGSLRCDANVSLRPVGETAFGKKTEVKNMNSFKAVQKALELEAERQKEILEEGGSIIQETRHYDEASNSTLTLRTKEEEMDYRYFPEPDLVPIRVEQNWIDEMQRTIPELPIQKLKRFIQNHQLSPTAAEGLVEEKEFAAFFEECLKLLNSPKTIANWMLGDLKAYLNAKNLTIKTCKLLPEHLTKLVSLIEKGTITGKIGKEILVQMLETGKKPEEIVNESGLTQISGEKELRDIIQKALVANPKSVEDYKKGKENALMFLVGSVMRETKGRANPEIVKKLLKDELSL